MYALMFAIALSTAPDLIVMDVYSSSKECNAVAFEVEQRIHEDSDAMVFCVEK